jgi:shikimate O-hydroxycinnamoyltransferase
MGKVGPAFRNLTVLIETKDGNGIEAWVTLDEERMAILERDPEFLAFASPNPKFSSL